MLNKTLIEKILGQKISGDVTIEGVEWQTQNSKKSDLLFYRIPENPSAEEVFRKRASEASYAYLIVNRPLENPPPRTIVISENNWMEIQKLFCDEIYPMPKMKLIGVTGTNGKTTTTDLILQIGSLVGAKGMSIGTLGLRYPDKTLLDFGLTSPSYIDLRKYLFHYGKDRDFCVMEVSSHALDQERFYKIRFDVGAWTSFSQDHLDYHETMEDYFLSKLKLVDLTLSQSILVPEGQESLKSQIEEHGKEVITAPLVEEKNLPLFLKSKFNQENLALAYQVITDLFPSFASPDLTSLVAPEGRFYIRKINESYVVVDFAHTPDALANICDSIRESFPGLKLHVLFGCGGDRDRSKRPLMTKVVLEKADRVYLTSDNPRFEEPEAIISDMLKGNENEKIEVIVDRKAAVEKALRELEDGAVLLLAGKGHENTISIKGSKIHYSDIEEVERFISERKA